MEITKLKMLHVGCFIICMTSLSNLHVFGKSVTALGRDEVKHDFAQDDVVLQEKPPTRRRCKERNSLPVSASQSPNDTERLETEGGKQDLLRPQETDSLSVSQEQIRHEFIDGMPRNQEKQKKKRKKCCALKHNNRHVSPDPNMSGHAGELREVQSVSTSSNQENQALSLQNGNGQSISWPGAGRGGDNLNSGSQQFIGSSETGSEGSQHWKVPDWAPTVPERSSYTLNLGSGNLPQGSQSEAADGSEQYVERLDEREGQGFTNGRGSSPGLSSQEKGVSSLTNDGEVQKGTSEVDSQSANLGTPENNIDVSKNDTPVDTTGKESEVGFKKRHCKHRKRCPAAHRMKEQGGESVQLTDNLNPPSGLTEEGSIRTSTRSSLTGQGKSSVMTAGGPMEDETQPTDKQANSLKTGDNISTNNSNLRTGEKKCKRKKGEKCKRKTGAEAERDVMIGVEKISKSQEEGNLSEKETKQGKLLYPEGDLHSERQLWNADGSSREGNGNRKFVSPDGLPGSNEAILAGNENDKFLNPERLPKSDGQSSSKDGLSTEGKRKEENLRPEVRPLSNGDNPFVEETEHENFLSHQGPPNSENQNLNAGGSSPERNRNGGEKSPEILHNSENQNLNAVGSPEENANMKFLSPKDLTSSNGLSSNGGNYQSKGLAKDKVESPEGFPHANGQFVSKDGPSSEGKRKEEFSIPEAHPIRDQDGSSVQANGKLLSPQRVPNPEHQNLNADGSSPEENENKEFLSPEDTSNGFSSRGGNSLPETNDKNRDLAPEGFPNANSLFLNKDGLSPEGKRQEEFSSPSVHPITDQDGSSVQRNENFLSTEGFPNSEIQNWKEGVSSPEGKGNRKFLSPEDISSSNGSPSNGGNSLPKRNNNKVLTPEGFPIANGQFVNKDGLSPEGKGKEEISNPLAHPIIDQDGSALERNGKFLSPQGIPNSESQNKNEGGSSPEGKGNRKFLTPEDLSFSNGPSSNGGNSLPKWNGKYKVSTAEGFPNANAQLVNKDGLSTGEKGKEEFSYTEGRPIVAQDGSSVDRNGKNVSPQGVPNSESQNWNEGGSSPEGMKNREFLSPKDLSSSNGPSSNEGNSLPQGIGKDTFLTSERFPNVNGQFVNNDGLSPEGKRKEEFSSTIVHPITDQDGSSLEGNGKILSPQGVLKSESQNWNEGDSSPEGKENREFLSPEDFSSSKGPSYNAHNSIPKKNGKDKVLTTEGFPNENGQFVNQDGFSLEGKRKEEFSYPEGHPITAQDGSSVNGNGKILSPQGVLNSESQNWNGDSSPEGKDNREFLSRKDLSSTNGPSSNGDDSLSQGIGKDKFLTSERFPNVNGQFVNNDGHSPEGKRKEEFSSTIVHPITDQDGSSLEGNGKIISPQGVLKSESQNWNEGDSSPEGKENREFLSPKDLSSSNGPSSNGDDSLSQGIGKDKFLTPERFPNVNDQFVNNDGLSPEGKRKEEFSSTIVHPITDQDGSSVEGNGKILYPHGVLKSESQNWNEGDSSPEGKENRKFLTPEDLSFSNGPSSNGGNSQPKWNGKYRVSTAEGFPNANAQLVNKDGLSTGEKRKEEFSYTEGHPIVAQDSSSVDENGKLLSAQGVPSSETQNLNEGDSSPEGKENREFLSLKDLSSSNGPSSNGDDSLSQGIGKDKFLTSERFPNVNDQFVNNDGLSPEGKRKEEFSSTVVHPIIDQDGSSVEGNGKIISPQGVLKSESQNWNEGDSSPEGKENRKFLTPEDLSFSNGPSSNGGNSQPKWNGKYRVSTAEGFPNANAQLVNKDGFSTGEKRKEEFSYTEGHPIVAQDSSSVDENGKLLSAQGVPSSETQNLNEGDSSPEGKENREFLSPKDLSSSNGPSSNGDDSLSQGIGKDKFLTSERFPNVNDQFVNNDGLSPEGKRKEEFSSTVVHPIIDQDGSSVEGNGKIISPQGVLKSESPNWNEGDSSPEGKENRKFLSPKDLSSSNGPSSNGDDSLSQGIGKDKFLTSERFPNVNDQFVNDDGLSPEGKRKEEFSSTIVHPITDQDGSSVEGNGKIVSPQGVPSSETQNLNEGDSSPEGKENREFLSPKDLSSSNGPSSNGDDSLSQGIGKDKFLTSERFPNVNDQFVNNDGLSPEGKRKEEFSSTVVHPITDKDGSSVEGNGKIVSPQGVLKSESPNWNEGDSSPEGKENRKFLTPEDLSFSNGPSSNGGNSQPKWNGKYRVSIAEGFPNANAQLVNKDGLSTGEKRKEEFSYTEGHPIVAQDSSSVDENGKLLSAQGVPSSETQNLNEGDSSPEGKENREFLTPKDLTSSNGPSSNGDDSLSQGIGKDKFLTSERFPNVNDQFVNNDGLSPEGKRKEEFSSTVVHPIIDQDGSSVDGNGKIVSPQGVLKSESQNWNEGDSSPEGKENREFLSPKDLSSSNGPSSNGDDSLSQGIGKDKFLTSERFPNVNDQFVNNDGLSPEGKRKEEFSSTVVHPITDKDGSSVEGNGKIVSPQGVLKSESQNWNEGDSSPEGKENREFLSPKDLSSSNGPSSNGDDSLSQGIGKDKFLTSERFPNVNDQFVNNDGLSPEGKRKEEFSSTVVHPITDQDGSSVEGNGKIVSPQGVLKSESQNWNEGDSSPEGKENREFLSPKDLSSSNGPSSNGDDSLSQGIGKDKFLTSERFPNVNDQFVNDDGLSPEGKRKEEFSSTVVHPITDQDGSSVEGNGKIVSPQGVLKSESQNWNEGDSSPEGKENREFLSPKDLSSSNGPSSNGDDSLSQGIGKDKFLTSERFPNVNGQFVNNDGLSPEGKRKEEFSSTVVHPITDQDGSSVEGNGKIVSPQGVFKSESQNWNEGDSSPEGKENREFLSPKDLSSSNGPSSNGDDSLSQGIDKNKFLTPEGFPNVNDQFVNNYGLSPEGKRKEEFSSSIDHPITDQDGSSLEGNGKIVSPQGVLKSESQNWNEGDSSPEGKENRKFLTPEDLSFSNEGDSSPEEMKNREFLSPKDLSSSNGPSSNGDNSLSQGIGKDKFLTPEGFPNVNGQFVNNNGLSPEGKRKEEFSSTIVHPITDQDGSSLEGNGKILYPHGVLKSESQNWNEGDSSPEGKENRKFLTPEDLSFSNGPSSNGGNSLPKRNGKDKVSIAEGFPNANAQLVNKDGLSTGEKRKEEFSYQEGSPIIAQDGSSVDENGKLLSAQGVPSSETQNLNEGGSSPEGKKNKEFLSPEDLSSSNGPSFNGYNSPPEENGKDKVLTPEGFPNENGQFINKDGLSPEGKRKEEFASSIVHPITNQDGSPLDGNGKILSPQGVPNSESQNWNEGGSFTEGKGNEKFLSPDEFSSSKGSSSNGDNSLPEKNGKAKVLTAEGFPNENGQFVNQDGLSPEGKRKKEFSYLEGRPMIAQDGSSVDGNGKMLSAQGVPNSESQILNERGSSPEGKENREFLSPKDLSSSNGPSSNGDDSLSQGIGKDKFLTLEGFPNENGQFINKDGLSPEGRRKEEFSYPEGRPITEQDGSSLEGNGKMLSPQGVTNSESRNWNGGSSSPEGKENWKLLSPEDLSSSNVPSYNGDNSLPQGIGKDKFLTPEGLPNTNGQFVNEDSLSPERKRKEEFSSPVIHPITDQDGSSLGGNGKFLSPQGVSSSESQNWNKGGSSPEGNGNKKFISLEDVSTSNGPSSNADNSLPEENGKDKVLTAEGFPNENGQFVNQDGFSPEGKRKEEFSYPEGHPIIAQDGSSVDGNGTFSSPQGVLNSESQNWNEGGSSPEGKGNRKFLTLEDLSFSNGPSSNGGNSLSQGIGKDKVSTAEGFPNANGQFVNKDGLSTGEKRKEEYSYLEGRPIIDQDGSSLVGNGKFLSPQVVPNSESQIWNEGGSFPEGKENREFLSPEDLSSSNGPSSNEGNYLPEKNGKEKVLNPVGFPNANGQFLDKSGLSPEGKRKQEFSRPIVRPITDQDGSSLEGKGKILSTQGVPNSESQNWNEGGSFPEGKENREFLSPEDLSSSNGPSSNGGNYLPEKNGKEKVLTPEGFPNANGQFLDKSGLSPEGKRKQEFSRPIVHPITDQDGSSLEGKGKFLSPQGVPNSESQNWNEGGSFPEGKENREFLSPEDLSSSNGPSSNGGNYLPEKNGKEKVLTPEGFPNANGQFLDKSGLSPEGKRKQEFSRPIVRPITDQDGSLVEGSEKFVSPEGMPNSESQNLYAGDSSPEGNGHGKFLSPNALPSWNGQSFNAGDSLVVWNGKDKFLTSEGFPNGKGQPISKGGLSPEGKSKEGLLISEGYPIKDDHHPNTKGQSLDKHNSLPSPSDYPNSQSLSVNAGGSSSDVLHKANGQFLNEGDLSLEGSQKAKFFSPGGLPNSGSQSLNTVSAPRGRYEKRKFLTPQHFPISDRDSSITENPSLGGNRKKIILPPPGLHKADTIWQYRNSDGSLVGTNGMWKFLSPESSPKSDGPAQPFKADGSPTYGLMKWNFLRPETVPFSNQFRNPFSPGQFPVHGTGNFKFPIPLSDSSSSQFGESSHSIPLAGNGKEVSKPFFHIGNLIRPGVPSSGGDSMLRGNEKGNYFVQNRGEMGPYNGVSTGYLSPFGRIHFPGSAGRVLYGPGSKDHFATNGVGGSNSGGPVNSLSNGLASFGGPSGAGFGSYLSGVDVSNAGGSRTGMESGVPAFGSNLIGAGHGIPGSWGKPSKDYKPGPQSGLPPFGRYHWTLSNTALSNSGQRDRNSLLPGVPLERRTFWSLPPSVVIRVGAARINQCFEDQLRHEIPALILKRDSQASFGNLARTLSEAAREGRENFLQILLDKNGLLRNVNWGKSLNQSLLLQKTLNWGGGSDGKPNTVGDVSATPDQTAAEEGGRRPRLLETFFNNLAQGKGLFGRKLLLGHLLGKRDLNAVSGTNGNLDGEELGSETGTARVGSAEDGRRDTGILENFVTASGSLSAVAEGLLELASEHADLVHSLSGSITNVKVVEVTPLVILRKVTPPDVWKSHFQVTLNGHSAAHGDFSSTAEVETAVQVLLRHNGSEEVSFRIVDDKTTVTKVQSRFDHGDGPPHLRKALDLLVQILLTDTVAQAYPDVISTINAECLKGLRDLVPLTSEDGRIQFFSAGPAVFTGDAFIFYYATTVQRADGSRVVLGGTHPLPPPSQGPEVDVVVSSSIPSAILSTVSPRNLSAMVWGDGVLSAEERRWIPEAPANGVVKAKFIGVRGPWISYTANPANAMLALTIKVYSKPEGEPALLTLKLEAHLTTTFEISGGKLIAELSLDSSDDISISTPVARTPVGRYRPWSEAVVRKTLAVLNREYKERAPTLSTLKHMSNPAVAISQDLLLIHETA